ncbi:thiamine phosphate synthase [Acidovorax sp. CCYZU-2555]|uniref:thiamine phosphate synthase n=1 Tax=Acidovorax sp. CCYZU-2555 TaxID=2835042 RepID=UPI001BD06CA7|nr:thiamine phosphate synthase [Acidovorax sp. CCYZU-2555]MBS7776849.1 thiamine phosphate synthase [Acidovorax sp. CCYZU-2555]
MPTIPTICQITPEPADPPHCEQFLGELSATLASGIRLVQFRAKVLPQSDLLQVAKLALAICRAHGARLVFNGPPVMALEVGCDGVHLDSQMLMSCKKRPAPSHWLVSAACHDAAQIAQAENIGVDFITLSPVFATKTHPEAIPMGWERFKALVAGTRVPIFALGGMRPDLLEDAKRNGAWGIAAISATWCKTPSVQ